MLRWLLIMLYVSYTSELQYIIGREFLISHLHTRIRWRICNFDILQADLNCENHVYETKRCANFGFIQVTVYSNNLANCWFLVRTINYKLHLKLTYSHFIVKDNYFMTNTELRNLWLSNATSVNIDLKGQCHKMVVEIRPWNGRLGLN
jgi:hypothetical protein